MRNLVIGSFFLSLAGSIWGGMFIAVRLSIFVIPPVPLVWMRYGTALLALIILMLMTHSSWHIDKKDRKLLVLSALSGQVLSIVTQETGTMMTSAQTGSVITAATPAFMVVFGYFLLHEKLTAGRIASVLLATIGVLFVVFDPDNFTVNPLGGASLFVAAVTWAFMSVLLKFLSKYSVITVTFYSVLIAFLTLTPYGLYWLLTAADIRPSSTLDAAITEALTLGRGGTVIENAKEKDEIAQSGRDIPVTFVPNEAALKVRRACPGKYTARPQPS